MTDIDVPGLVERILSMPHRMDCGLLGGYDGGCTCGHDQAVADVEAQAQKIASLTARVEKLGRDLNMARYGQPDFAWSVHKQAMADLEAENARLLAAGNQARLAFAGYVSEQSAVDKLDAALAAARKMKGAVK